MTNALAVVAHFDDAIIWAGGAIRRTSAFGWSWTIVCTCVAEPSRRVYFLESCSALGVRAVALAFVDHPDGGPFSRNDRAALSGAVEGAVTGPPIDWIFTHSLDPEGEYGPHPNHTEAAGIVGSLVHARLASPDHVAHFAYRRAYGPAGLPSVAAPEASHYLQLNYDELAWKAEWCARARDVEVNDPAVGGISWLEKLGWPCPNPEAFSGEGLLLPAPFARR